MKVLTIPILIFSTFVAFGFSSSWYFSIMETNPINDLKKDYVSWDINCNRSLTLISKIHYSETRYVENDRLSLKQVLTCLDTVEYPRNSPEYRAFSNSYLALLSLNEQDFIPSSISQMLQLNAPLLDLNKAIKTPTSPFFFYITFLTSLVICTYLFFWMEELFFAMRS